MAFFAILAVGVGVAMLLAIGISTVIGVALALRFNVLVLIPAIILAVISTAVIAAARGDQAWSVVFTVVLVVTTLQISYLAGSVTLMALKRHLQRQIQAHMEVVGSDGKHVGTVDHTESADRIVLTGDDPKAGGKPHLISVEWVDYVDSKVHLNRPSRIAVMDWRIAA
jgi:hypothetical protein